MSSRNTSSSVGGYSCSTPDLLIPINQHRVDVGGLGPFQSLDNRPDDAVELSHQDGHRLVDQLGHSGVGGRLECERPSCAHQRQLLSRARTDDPGACEQVHAESMTTDSADEHACPAHW